MVSPVSFIGCETMSEFKLLNETINARGYGDYVISAFTVPQFAIRNFFTNERKIGTSYTAYALTGTPLYQGMLDITNIPATPNSLDGYVPVNQKLRTYPYMYLGFNPLNRWFKNIQI